MLPVTATTMELDRRLPDSPPSRIWRYTVHIGGQCRDRSCRTGWEPKGSLTAQRTQRRLALMTCCVGGTASASVQPTHGSPLQRSPAACSIVSPLTCRDWPGAARRQLFQHVREIVATMPFLSIHAHRSCTMGLSCGLTLCLKILTARRCGHRQCRLSRWSVGSATSSALHQSWRLGRRFPKIVSGVNQVFHKIHSPLSWLLYSGCASCVSARTRISG